MKLLKDVLSALKIDKDYSLSYFYAGLVYLHRNDLAWLYLTEKDFKNTDRAFSLAEEAVSLERQPYYIDTLACAYAEKGGFDKAIELEKEAYSLSTNIYYKKIIDIFENKLTYLEWKEKNPDLEKKVREQLQSK